MKLACASPVVPGDTLTEKALRLKDWGYDGIAVFQDYESWDETGAGELAGLERRTGIRPCEFVLSGPLYGHLMDPQDGLRSTARKMYRTAALECDRLGAVTELEYSYGPQKQLPMFDPYRSPDERQYQAFLRMYSEIAAGIGKGGGAVLIEPINRYESPFFNTVDACIRVVDDLALPSVGLLRDLFHMNMEETNLGESIRRAGERIRYVHLADNNRLPPGMGSINWYTVFAALKNAGYDGWLTLECAVCGDAAKTLPETAERIGMILRSI